MNIKEKCCVEGCLKKGEYPLSKIQGKVKIKKDLVNTVPRDWKICKDDFQRMLKEMKCCVEGCLKEPTFHEITESRRKNVQIKNDCSHIQLCLIHARQFSELADAVPIKREPTKSGEQFAPVVKKHAESEDTATESNNENNSDTSTEVHDENEAKMNEEQQKNESVKKYEVSVIVKHEDEVPKEGNQQNEVKDIPVKVENTVIPKENKMEEVPMEEMKEKPIVTEKVEQPIESKNSENKQTPTKESNEQELKEINVEIKQETEVKNEVEPIEDHHCCISGCDNQVFGEVPILQPLHFHICEEHLTKIIKLWKVSLLQKQVVLDKECLDLIKEKVGDNTQNPLCHYTNPPTPMNDIKCALCCGLHTTDETYSCSFCPFTFCVECYKHLCLTLGCPQQFISNKARWKCFVCSRCEENQMQRNVFIKQQLESLLEILKKQLDEGCLIGTGEDELREFIESLK